MKRILAVLAIRALAHCNSTHLPPPGEPVRGDVDELWRLKEESREQARNDSLPAYPDPELQQAYEAGYAAGYVDAQRRRPSDPEPHLAALAPAHRSAFTAGYTAGFAR